MKQRAGKRLLSFLLALAMAVGLFPGMGVPVLAEETGAFETLNLSEMQSERYYESVRLPTENTMTFSGYNAKAEGHAWDKDGWLIGRFDNTSYDGLTFRALRGKIVKVVLQTDALYTDGLNRISVDDTNGSITTDGSKKIYKASAVQGVATVSFRYEPDSSKENDFVQFLSATVYYATADSYTVTVNKDENSHITMTAESGAETQPNLSGPMVPVTYRANDGYIFPIVSDCYKTIFGIAVKRISDTEVTVSGTPIVDTCVTVPDAVPTTDTIGSFSLNLNDVPVPVNGLQELIATVGPYNVTDKRVKWSVTGDAVKLYTDSTCAIEVGEAATDLRTVYAKGISEGTATVTVTSNLDSKKSASCEVTVEKEVSEWAVGDSINLYGKYFLYYDDGKIAENLKQSRNIPHSIPAPDRIIEGWWRFPEAVHVTDDEDPVEGLFFGRPEDRSWDEIPSGFRIKEGDGSKENPYQFELVYKHNVTVKPASNMTKTPNSGAAEQKGLTGKMEDVVYLADEGYYFPENYSVGEYDEDYDVEDGIIVTRDSSAQITVSGKPLTHITINLPPPTAKGQAAVAQAPAARTLTYNGQAQELVTAGTATGGEMQYALGNATEATQPYTTSIPTATNAGTYYVWYKVAGDENHNDSEAASVTVTITKAAQAAPAAPTAESVTENSVTLKKTDRYQYSMDGTAWQDSNVFSGLSQNTEYTFYQRIAGDENHEPSPAGQGTAITTGSVVYTVTESKNTEHTIGSGDDAVYTVKRNVNDADETFKNFTGATVDGSAIPDGGSTAKSGSLILTLKSSYLDTLSVGDHNMKISFVDGTVEVPLKIKAATPTPSPTPAPTPSPTPHPVPQTGDNDNPVLWVGLILLGIAGLAVPGVMKASRKRR